MRILVNVTEDDIREGNIFAEDPIKSAITRTLVDAIGNEDLCAFQLFSFNKVEILDNNVPIISCKLPRSVMRFLHRRFRLITSGEPFNFYLVVDEKENQ